MRHTSAIPAIAHGSDVDVASGRRAPDAPAAVPQRWQNFAPGVRIVAQAAHRAPASGEPQLAQKCPLAGTPHAGHGTGAGAAADSLEEGTVMLRNLVEA
jgi:hypothetical protein